LGGDRAAAELKNTSLMTVRWRGGFNWAATARSQN
jgi:hypothetical protein